MHWIVIWYLCWIDADTLDAHTQKPCVIKEGAITRCFVDEQLARDFASRHPAWVNDVQVIRIQDSAPVGMGGAWQ